MSLELPPIHERQGDLPLLVAHFLGAEWTIEDDAMKALERYDWPGNVRQLINAIERGKIMAEDNIVRLRDLPREIMSRSAKDSSSILVATDDLSSIERAKVIEVLRRESGNKTRAAKTLGIDRRKLYRLVEKYDIKASEVAVVHS